MSHIYNLSYEWSYWDSYEGEPKIPLEMKLVIELADTELWDTDLIAVESDTTINDQHALNRRLATHVRSIRAARKWLSNRLYHAILQEVVFKVDVQIHQREINDLTLKQLLWLRDHGVKNGRLEFVLIKYVPQHNLNLSMISENDLVGTRYVERGEVAIQFYVSQGNCVVPLYVNFNTKTFTVGITHSYNELRSYFCKNIFEYAAAWDRCRQFIVANNLSET